MQSMADLRMRLKLSALWSYLLFNIIVLGTFVNPCLTHAADWSMTESVKEITAVTHDKDGNVRETTIWIVTNDQEAYVRTSGTHWERSMKRDPRLILKIAGQDYPVLSTRVNDRATIKDVQSRFRSKYGWADYLARGVRVLMGGGSHIYHVTTF